MVQQRKTIREAALLWTDDKRQYVKRSTISAYLLILENHINPEFGDEYGLKEEDIQDFAMKKLRQGLSRKSVKDILTVLKMVLKYGVRYGHLDSYTDWAVRFPTESGTRSLEVLARTDQKKIMDYLMSHFTFRNLGIYICLCTGLRIGEICALTWSDIDIERGTIHIRRTLGRIYVLEGERRHTELIFNTPKTRNSMREVPMTRNLMKMVRPLKKVVNGDFFVLTNSDRPIEPRSYRNYYKSLMAQLNIPPLKFHGLRHSFATRCIESKCDYKTVSVLLGHSNISTTLDLYVHPDFDQKRRCVEQMSRSLK